MPAGVIDDLELVDVEIAERIGSFPRLRTLQRPLQTTFELPPVDAPGEQIVTGMIGEPPLELARLADVVAYQYSTCDMSGPIADGGGSAFVVELVAGAADEEHREHRLDRPDTADGYAQGVVDR